MREQLLDILKQSSSLFTIIKITGSTTETIIEASDEGAVKNIFLKGVLKEPISEFVGEFGISNLSMVNGFLNFPSYNTEKSAFRVLRERHGDVEFVSQFKFEDGVGGHSDFRLTPPKLVPAQFEIGKIPWEIEFTPDSSRIKEFEKLAALYSGVDKSFIPKTVNGNLVFIIGEENSSTHSGTMVFEPTDVKLRAEAKFNSAHFLAALKLAGSNPVRVGFTSVGVLRVQIETPHGLYDYILRGSRD